MKHVIFSRNYSGPENTPAIIMIVVHANVVLIIRVEKLMQTKINK